jgi:hypothetical protein
MQKYISDEEDGLSCKEKRSFHVQSEGCVVSRVDDSSAFSL